MVPDVRVHRNDPAVRQAHRDYLFMRDYAGLCAVFIVLYGVAGMFFIPSMRVVLIYLVVHQPRGNK